VGSNTKDASNQNKYIFYLLGIYYLKNNKKMAISLINAIQK